MRARCAQIEAALAWAKEAQLKIVLVGGDDAWRVAPQLKESDTPVIIGPSTTLPLRRDDGYDSGWSNAAKLHEAGVRFCIASNGRDAEAHTNATVGYRSRSGCSLWFAERGGVQSRHALPGADSRCRRSLGSLESGKAATLIVTNGDPLDFPTQVEAAYIDGRKIDLSTRQTRLRDKYREKYLRK